LDRIRIIQCPVCQRGNSFIKILGLCEEGLKEWRVIEKEKGNCKLCGFHYTERANDSFEKQVNSYKKIFFKRIIKKIKNR